MKGSSESSTSLVLNQNKSGCSSRKRTQEESSSLGLRPVESGHSSSKRAANADFAGRFFDLNLPADTINNS